MAVFPGRPPDRPAIHEQVNSRRAVSQDETGGDRQARDLAIVLEQEMPILLGQVPKPAVGIPDLAGRDPRVRQSPHPIAQALDGNGDREPVREHATQAVPYRKGPSARGHEPPVAGVAGQAEAAAAERCCHNEKVPSPLIAPVEGAGKAPVPVDHAELARDFESANRLQPAKAVRGRRTRTSWREGAAGQEKGSGRKKDRNGTTRSESPHG